MASALPDEVSRTGVTQPGAASAIRRQAPGVITPAPVGIGPTRPTMSAPWAAAIAASSGEAMQQILTRIRVIPRAAR